ncbi:MAG TPA: hypothetical protein VFA52_01740 [Candidatus Paceibacterota bacterium]|nr:hypothetical protein [Candidatus Paceibacterota bacterium]
MKLIEFDSEEWCLELRNVSTVEILVGLLARLDNKWFSDEQFYDWIISLGDKELVRRFGIRETEPATSKSFSLVFSALTIGKILEESLEAGPNLYRRKISPEVLIKDLTDREVWPRYENLFCQLAENFREHQCQYSR